MSPRERLLAAMRREDPDGVPCELTFTPTLQTLFEAKTGETDVAEYWDFEERVRLYSPQELAALLSDVGLVTEHRFGDYEGADFVPESPRLILAGRLHTREESIS